METLNDFTRRTFSLMLWFVGLQGMYFFYDLLFHAKVSHPFWNEHYDWWPIVLGAIMGAMIASALWMAAKRYAPLLFARTQRQLRLDNTIAGLALLHSKSVRTASHFSALAKRPQLVQ